MTNDNKLDDNKPDGIEPDGGPPTSQHGGCSRKRAHDLTNRRVEASISSRIKSERDRFVRGQLRASRVNDVGQATKSMRWMPWRQEPTKDVAGSEMLRGVASKR